MKYKLIIFDFDGTLADTFPWFINVINQVADKYKFRRIKTSEVETLRGYSAMKVMKHLQISFWKMPIIANHMRGLMTKDINKIVLFDGVDDILQQLSNKGVRLAVVSSNSYDNISQILGTENLALIDYYECGVSIFGKPAKLRKIIMISGVKHNESIFIGDEVRDIEAAKNINIASGAVSWGYNRIEKLKEQFPDELFVSIDEIIEKTA
jgi:phosphoglycolate phosphatase